MNNTNLVVSFSEGHKDITPFGKRPFHDLRVEDGSADFESVDKLLSETTVGHATRYAESSKPILRLVMYRPLIGCSFSVGLSGGSRVEVHFLSGDGGAWIFP